MSVDEVEVAGVEGGADSVDEASVRPRGRVGKLLAVALGVVVALVVLAAVVFFVGREKATELSDDEAVTQFRATNAGTSASAEPEPGRPVAGVYSASATGTESLGLPGFDVDLGPNAPVTVTHLDEGCFTFRVDFNSQHWRSWTFCSSDTAAQSLVELQSWTARRAPGLDLETLTTYTCERPVDLRWDGAAPGETRTGACAGRSDVEEGVTSDRAEVEASGRSVVTVAGEDVQVDVVKVSNAFSGAQTGYESGQWWFDADTGLPLRVAIEAELGGGAGSYSERFDLELTAVEPAT